MTLTLHARVATNSQMNEPNRSLASMEKNVREKKLGACAYIVRLYRKFLLHLLLLNEPICSDTHKLNNLRVKRSEEKLRNKRPSKGKTWYSHSSLSLSLSAPKSRNENYGNVYIRVICICVYGVYAMPFKCLHQEKGTSNDISHEKWNGTEIQNRLQ